jgi:hypothetical protein
MTSQTTATATPTMMQFNSLTLAAAATAAIAATASAGLGWPVWGMFIGWVAFFTGGHSARQAISSYLCVALGIAFGVAAAAGVGTLLPIMDYFAFGFVVFLVAIVVVLLRAAPWLNSIPAYFLGLITFFAAHVEPGLPAFLELIAVSALGTFAAWVAHRLQMRVARRTR